LLYNSASDDDDDDLEDAAAGEVSDADDQWFEGAEPMQPSLEYHYPLEEYTAEDDDEEDEEVFEGALLDMPAERQREAGEKRRTGRYGKTAGKQLPPYIENLLGKANSALMAGRTDVALAALKESIRQAPEAPQSYQSLAAYAADIGNHQLELEVNMCMCGLNKKVRYTLHTLCIIQQAVDSLLHMITCSSIVLSLCSLGR
jgi:predicted Zn-dependent protease